MYLSTLTSFAMLKVMIDQGGDYLQYLRPFVLHVLTEQQHEKSITSKVVQDGILSSFGMVIPERTVDIVLRRIARESIIQRENHVYHVSGRLPDGSDLNARRNNAKRHIAKVVRSLIDFSKDTRHPFRNEDHAMMALCAFLEEFGILCLRAFLRNTTIPKSNDANNWAVIVVGQYVLNLYDREPELFGSFMVVVQGHMFANALLCPDLDNAPGTYRGVTFYLDTPVVIKVLGLDGKNKEDASKELLTILRKLDATIAIFRHTKEELINVITGAAHYLDSRDGRGEIVMEARRANRSKSDLLIVAETLDEILTELNIQTMYTPAYNKKFQISETAFENVLGNELQYNNPNARLYDVNSVRSIYTIRAGKFTSKLENCVAALVSSNTAFAKAADAYGKEHEHQESREVSTVITDYSLVNLAWLKLPMDAPDLPKKEVLAYAYASQTPSNEMLHKYVGKVEESAKAGKINPAMHRLLRSSPLAQEELMRLTSGDTESMSENTVKEVENRIIEKLTQDQNEQLRKEKKYHQKMQGELNHWRKDAYSRCERKANRYSCWIYGATTLVVLTALYLLGAAFIKIFGINVFDSLVGTATVASTFVTLLTLLGWTLKGMRVKLEQCLLKKILARSDKDSNLNLSEFRDKNSATQVPTSHDKANVAK